MPEENLELSSSGLKVSYLRFLADGAAGLILILVMMAVYYVRPEWHVFGISREVKIFILFVLVMLAIPLGLLVNAIGWFLFSGLQASAARFWFKHHSDFLVRVTSEVYSFDRIVKKFGLDKGNFYEMSHFYEDALLIYHRYISADIAHIRGIKTLVRSLPIIVLFATLFLWARLGWWCLIALPIVGLLLILLTLLEYYERLGALQKSYILSPDESVLSENGGVLKRLVRGSPLGRSVLQGDAGTEP